jgi:signal transduction histidine kinase
VRVAREGELVVIGVHDNGAGIDAGVLPHVFDLFTQAERTPDRAQGGLGIGLALVKTIISLHEGEVTADSNGLGTGSVFTVTLKAAGPSVQDV